MAVRGSTVRVTGLPSDINQDRLEDKLCIHFQRGSNGGGEVVSVTAVKTSPDLALITFEDSRVAQRVIQKQHILEVEGKRHNLIVSEHPGNLQQDKVIINLSATIDCSHLSGGRKTLKTLLKSHPEVHIAQSSIRELFTLSGSYSTVQAALAQLLGHPQPPQNTELNHQPGTENKPNYSTALPESSQVSNDQSNASHVQTRRDKTVERHNLQRDITPGGYDWDSTCQVQGATASLPAPEEDFSLMVDADMFQYLQKHCGEEYHQILRQHGVAVVDFTHQGLTTLLLQVASGDGVRDQECLGKARNEISRLYEENQANICREKISKTILPNREGLKRALMKLTGRFAKLLFNEDDQNIYVIGSRDEVAEAKRFLLLHDHSEEDKTEITSPRKFMDSWPADEVKVPHASATSSNLQNGLEQVRSGEEENGKLEAANKYKLAAHFKDLSPIGSKTSDFTVRGHSNKQSRQGPMLGYDVLTDTKENANANVDTNLKASTQNTSAVLKTTPTTDLLDTKPKASTVSPIQSDSLASLTPSPVASGSSLRRTSSFSGTSQKRDQEISPRSLDDSDKGKKIGRSSSFSSGTKHSAEITVNNIMWRHITEAYKPRIEELTSGLQFREKRLEGGRDVTVLLTGTISANVRACHEGLKKLIDSVNVDFSVKALALSELGVNDTNDETLQTCCAEIRSLYKKMSMQIYRENLYLFGPEILCTQICDTLREVFAGALTSKQQDYSRPSTSGSDSQISSSSARHGKTELQDGRRKDLRAAELVNGQTSPRREAVIKEKVKKPAGVGMDAYNSINGNINGSATSLIDKKPRIGGNKSTTAATGGQRCSFCRQERVQLKKTECSLSMCHECLVTLHTSCNVCEKKEPKHWGIQGEMSYSKLPMSIPGYIKDPVIKITYRIPDGIQGESDPSPGKPFKGNLFEAFLPDCEPTRRLLPRLQEAFRRGHTFTITGDRVNWDSIPHKTSLQGGRTGSGYPDSSYLSRLSASLDSLDIP